MGLRYVNNDACYPSLLVVGQIMEAVLSGRYDTDRLAVVMSQTGGGCRATNYIGFIRRALEKAGYQHIPVISINLSKLEKNPGFKITPMLLLRAVYAINFGDIFMRCVYRMRPYEAVPGSVEQVHQKWIKKCCDFLGRKYMSFGTYKKMCREMIAEFDAIPVLDIKKPRVGIVGEILVKFSPAANNKLVELLEHEGAEAVVPDLMDFMFYCFYNQLYKAENLGTSKKAASISRFGIKAIQMLRKPMSEAFAASRHFIPPADIYETAKHAEEIVSIGNQTGEPCCRQGCHQGAQESASGCKHRRDRLRSRRFRGQSAQPDQADALHRAEEYGQSGGDRKSRAYYGKAGDKKEYFPQETRQEQKEEQREEQICMIFSKRALYRGTCA